MSWCMCIGQRTTFGSLFSLSALLRWCLSCFFLFPSLVYRLASLGAFRCLLSLPPISPKCVGLHIISEKKAKQTTLLELGILAKENFTTMTIRSKLYNTEGVNKKEKGWRMKGMVLQWGS